MANLGAPYPASTQYGGANRAIDTDAERAQYSAAAESLETDAEDAALWAAVSPSDQADLITYWQRTFTPPSTTPVERTTPKLIFGRPWSASGLGAR